MTLNKITSQVPQVSLPEDVRGDWSVQRFEVTERAAELCNLRAAFGHSRERIVAGTYTKLCHQGSIVMSDTPTECRDHLPLYYRASGHILISGLGLGVAIQACLLKLGVTQVTVIEIANEVIQLVAPHYQARFGERFEVIQADIRTWKPSKGTKYDAVWHDIWNTLCPDNWEDMKTLKRRFQFYTHWQQCWCEDETHYRQGR